MDTLDKVFKAYDVRGVYPTEINEDLAWRIGFATGQFLRSLLTGYDRGQAAANRVIVGRDMRPSSETLAKNLMDGILSAGVSCVDIGMIDTPMIYFAINQQGSCGGIQVTASHNPIEYNGFKVSGQRARPVGENTGLKDIKHIVSSLRRAPTPENAARSATLDLWAPYRKHVLNFLKLTRPMRVAVDASNGMAGKMFPAVFDGTELSVIPINFTVGGTFAHPPNPSVDNNLRQIQEVVRSNPVDFGVCFDGDADRCIFIDERGEIVRCDHITALLAQHFLKMSPDSTVVYDLRSSRSVPEDIKAAGGISRRERVGHAFIKKAISDTRAVLGGELSGHFYFRDNFNADSGAIAFATVASIISASDCPLSQLIAPMKRYVQSGELNFRVQDKPEKIKALAEKFADGQIDYLDGITVQYPDWWFNVRPSNTEPLLRLNLEAKDTRSMDAHLGQIRDMLGVPVNE